MITNTGTEFCLRSKTELKMEYLEQLNGLLNTYKRHLSLLPEKETIIERIAKVCDSIESDLGIKKETVAGNIVVKMSVDTSNLERKLKELGEMTAESGERTANGLRIAAERIGQS